MLRKAQAQEAAIGYQRTVLQAWHDVDNALDAYRREQERRDQLWFRRWPTTAARCRWRRAATSRAWATFLDVLTAETNLLSTEQQLASSTTTVSDNLVALYKALGGGWEATYPIIAGGQPGGGM